MWKMRLLYDGIHLTTNFLYYVLVKKLKNFFWTSGLKLERTLRSWKNSVIPESRTLILWTSGLNLERTLRALKAYFLLIVLYYRFMEVFKKRILLCLSIPVASIILSRKLQVSEKHIAKMQVVNEEVHIYKYLKIYMDKYVLHYDSYTSDMDNVDVVLGYP